MNSKLIQLLVTWNDIDLNPILIFSVILDWALVGFRLVLGALKIWNWTLGCVRSLIDLLTHYQPSGQFQTPLFFSFSSAADEDCQSLFKQTAYTGNKATITCRYPQNRDKSRFWFLCKDRRGTCEQVLPSAMTKGNFNTVTRNGTRLSLNNVSMGDSGFYWCGVRTNSGLSVRRIQLVVQGRGQCMDKGQFPKNPADGVVL